MTLSSWMPRTVRRIYLHRIVIGTDKSQMKVSSEDFDLIYPVKTTVNNVIDILMRIDEYLLLEEVWKNDSNLEEVEYVFICQACQSRVSRLLESPTRGRLQRASISWKSGSSARKRLLQNRRIAYVAWNIYMAML